LKRHKNGKVDKHENEKFMNYKCKRIILRKNQVREQIKMSLVG
jgi:hypothetical protein